MSGRAVYAIYSQSRMNITDKGRAWWRDNGIQKSQVLKMHQFIEHENPEIYNWFISKVEHAVDQGWLKTS